MFVGGVTAVYLDWYRRIILEDACDYEEKAQSMIHARKAMIQSVFLRKPSIAHDEHY